MKKVILSLAIIVISFSLFKFTHLPQQLFEHLIPRENNSIEINDTIIAEASSALKTYRTAPMLNTNSENNSEEIIPEIVEISQEPTDTNSEEVTQIYEGKRGCQIWLTQDAIATDCETNEQITIEEGTKLIIAEDSDDVVVRCEYSGKDYFVNTQFALINIAQYVPVIQIGLDLANQTNYFNMNGESIPNLTDRQFYTSESATSGDAWLMIEVAEKLYHAQEQFLADGYTIKIYDAYRPYTCTKDFSVAFKKFLDSKPQSFVNDGFGSLGMGWFLAQKASSHNYGVAVDMTLVCLETGDELEMPSKMHTLDKSSAREYWAKDSVAYQNADYMYSVMKNNGFTELKSEWWHFQDNEVERPDEPIDFKF